MKIIAIEASAKVAGVCIMEDEKILAEENVCSGLTHSQTLMPMVDTAMRAAGLSGEEMDLITFTKGPGSFTGLRIGAATVKGLSLGWKKPVLPLSTLEVMAYGLIPWTGLIVPVMDARRQQVYTAVYRSDGKNLQEILPQQAISAADLAAFLKTRNEKALLVGDVYTMPEDEEFVQALSHLLQIRSASACALALKKLSEGLLPVSSDQVEVDYLRRPQAERERLEKENHHAETD